MRVLVQFNFQLGLTDWLSFNHKADLHTGIYICIKSIIQCIYLYVICLHLYLDIIFLKILRIKQETALDCTCRGMLTSVASDQSSVHASWLSDWHWKWRGTGHLQDSTTGRARKNWEDRRNTHTHTHTQTLKLDWHSKVLSNTMGPGYDTRGRSSQWECAFALDTSIC